MVFEEFRVNMIVIKDFQFSNLFDDYKMDLQHFRYPFTRNVFKILKIKFEKKEIVHN